MKAVLIAALILSVGSAVLPAFAANTMSQSTLNRRVVNGCMTRQMAASRTLSYNDAAKLCKDQLKARNDALANNNEAKPANAR